MPRYKLRTLLILLAIGPPMLAVSYWIAATYWHYERTHNVFTSKDGVHGVPLLSP